MACIGKFYFFRKKILFKWISKTQKGRACPEFIWVRIQEAAQCALVYMVIMACGKLRE
jgi:hypothetical protein